jgi:hypothetical protein
MKLRRTGPASFYRDLPYKSPPLAIHGAKRHVMAPEGHVMTENDTSWGPSLLLARRFSGTTDGSLGIIFSARRQAQQQRRPDLAFQ